MERDDVAAALPAPGFPSEGPEFFILTPRGSARKRLKPKTQLDFPPQQQNGCTKAHWVGGWVEGVCDVCVCVCVGGRVVSISDGSVSGSYISVSVIQGFISTCAQLMQRDSEAALAPGSARRPPEIPRWLGAGGYFTPPPPQPVPLLSLSFTGSDWTDERLQDVRSAVCLSG